MPQRPPSVCRNLGCGKATRNINGFCDDCQQAGIIKRKRKKKTNPFYGSAKWKRFRNWYAAKQPLCENCLEKGIFTEMNVVDHIIELKDGGAPLSEDNAKSLCNKCHALKTSRKKMERGGLVESPPTPSALPFGSQKLPPAKLERGGIERGNSDGKR